ncbi:fasciclin domain-containing protein [Alkalibacterium sp. f15]|uniref:fasciclin domain-containing protein n=1 Tax=Alkalibacterium sp. f15 TaxID=3414029 RepID=UPI003BF7E8D5
MSKMVKVFLSFITAFALTVALAPTAFADSHVGEEPSQDIVEIALGNDDFSILVSALQRAELVETLQGEGPFTVFAPTNQAFADLLEALDITAEELLAQPDLAKVLTYHVVPGKVLAGDLTDGMEAETVNGEMVTFDLSGDPMVNDSMIVDTDIEATNGVIHVIDTVLVPSDFTLQEVDMEETDVPETGIETNSVLLIGMLMTGAALIFVMVKPLKQK